MLRTVVRRPGRLVVTADAIHAVLPLDAIDVDHRRAGLDQSPGHAPWLGRRVVIELVGGDVR
jgi:hypothetical protein